MLQGFGSSTVRGKKEFIPSCLFSFSFFFPTPPPPLCLPPHPVCLAVQPCSGAQVTLTAGSEGGTEVFPQVSSRGILDDAHFPFQHEGRDCAACLLACLFKKEYSLSDVLVLEK